MGIDWQYWFFCFGALYFAIEVIGEVIAALAVLFRRK